MVVTLSDNTPSNGDSVTITGHDVDISSSADDKGKKAVQITGLRRPGMGTAARLCLYVCLFVCIFHIRTVHLDIINVLFTHQLIR